MTATTPASRGPASSDDRPAAAAASGCDTTDHSLSSSARAFVPFYAQRLSATSAMNAAQGIHKGIEQRHRAHLKGGRLAPRART